MLSRPILHPTLYLTSVLPHHVHHSLFRTSHRIALIPPMQCILRSIQSKPPSLHVSSCTKVSLHIQLLRCSCPMSWVCPCTSITSPCLFMSLQLLLPLVLALFLSMSPSLFVLILSLPLSVLPSSVADLFLPLSVPKSFVYFQAVPPRPCRSFICHPSPCPCRYSRLCSHALPAPPAVRSQSLQSILPWPTSSCQSADQTS